MVSVTWSEANLTWRLWILLYPGDAGVVADETATPSILLNTLNPVLKKYHLKLNHPKCKGPIFLFAVTTTIPVLIGVTHVPLSLTLSSMEKSSNVRGIATKYGLSFRTMGVLVRTFGNPSRGLSLSGTAS